MNFFKSVFSDDPEPSSSPNHETTPPESPNPNPESPDFASITTAWSFGSTLLKTLATKSESVLETYRRDIEDFSSGLKLETTTIREAATRAVHDLPARLESGAAVAQTSLESVGQAIDDIAEVIVARGKDSMAILAADGGSESESDDGDGGNDGKGRFDAKPYSRIEAAIRSVQCDLKTYCEEPEDLGEFGEWRGGVLVEERRGEIQGLLEENRNVREIYDEVVPVRVDHETFWLRYFYRVYKMEKAEEARLRLVKRAIESDEEDLSWDVDDDDEEGEGEGTSGGGFKTMDELKKEIEENVNKVEDLVVAVEEKGIVVDGDRDGEKESVADTTSDDIVEEKGRADEVESSSEKVGKFDEKASSEGKNDNSDFSVVSSQPSHEEDIGWDEIEDIGSDDENKVVSRTSPDRTDLRKRLSAAEEDEDLTWDIEDDNEPAKS